MTAALEPKDTDVVYAAARTGEPDRFAAALLAPRSARDDLVALAAFAGEVRKIPQQVREPHMGEIRLQWWRDALSDGLVGRRSGNPVADTFAASMRAHALPVSLVSDHLDAYAHALYADAPADEAALQLEWQLKEGVLFGLAARILGAGTAEGEANLIGQAAQAYGAMHAALELPYNLARGRWPLPSSGESETETRENAPAALTALIGRARMHLTQARPQFRTSSKALRTAVLPLALVEPYLAALEKPGHDAAHDIANIAPLTRMTRLALSHWRGAL